MIRRLSFVALLLVAGAHAAAAQTPAGGPASGPLVLEPIESRFVVAPEYKVTSFDNRTGQLAGVSAGQLTDKAFFIGGGLYWLANRQTDYKLTYGGVLAGWTTPLGDRVRVGGRALAGFGTATLGDTVTFRDPRRLDIRTFRVLQHDDFLVAEPQAQASIGLTDRVGVDVAGGYRFTGNRNVPGDRLNGATGAVSLQFGW